MPGPFTPKLQLSRMNIDDVPVTPSIGSSFQPTPKFDVSLPSPAPPTPATPAPISSDSDVDKMKHPSGIVPTLQYVYLLLTKKTKFLFISLMFFFTKIIEILYLLLVWVVLLI